MNLNCYILQRDNLAIKAHFTPRSYIINRDYLTNEKSNFELDRLIEAEQGDFIIAKDKIISSDLGSIVYFGVVDSREDNDIDCTDLYSLLNFDFVATRQTGDSFERHLHTLIDYYLLSDPSTEISDNVTVNIASNTPFSFQPSESPAARNLTTYLIDCFRKYNITWNINNIEYDENRQLRVNTVIAQKTRSLNIKNNAFAFVNWSIYVTPAGRASENRLLIVDSTTTNSEAPIILSTWYTDMLGNLTQDASNVRTPVKTRIFIYDREQEDPPTYQQVARSELNVNLYAHEIEFDLVKNNNLITLEDLEIGLKVNIVYNDMLYQSVLTGYIINHQSEFVSLKFGHIRSTFADVL